MGWGSLSSDSGRAAGILAALGLIVLLSRVALLGEEVSTVVEYAGNAGLNTVDQQRMIVGYYEGLAPAGPAVPYEKTGKAGTRLGDRPQEFKNRAERMVRDIASQAERFVPHEFLLRDQKANFHRPAQSSEGYAFNTNRWGMRDRDYEKKKPGRTFRIALVGGSNSMGQGVAYEDAFATIVEQQLNEKLSGGAYDAYELLNFSVTGYFMPSRLWVMEHRVEAFAPDLILLTILASDKVGIHSELAKRLYAKPSFEALHFDFYKRIVTEAGITSDDFEDFVSMSQKLHKYRAALLREELSHAAGFAKRSGIPVVGLVINLEHGESRRSSKAIHVLAETAERVGLPVLRVFDALKELSEQEAYISRSNEHPSPLGHWMLAEEILTRMMGHNMVRRMLLNPPPDQPAGAP